MPPDDFNAAAGADLPPAQAIANLVETYGLAGVMRGLRQYVQSKTALLQAVDSDRAYAWLGLVQLLKPVVDIAERIDSDAERGR